MSDAKYYFRRAAINATFATAAQNAGDISLFLWFRERAVYFTAKGLEALALGL